MLSSLSFPCVLSLFSVFCSAFVALVLVYILIHWDLPRGVNDFCLISPQICVSGCVDRCGEETVSSAGAFVFRDSGHASRSLQLSLPARVPAPSHGVVDVLCRKAGYILIFLTVPLECIL